MLAGEIVLHSCHGGNTGEEAQLHLHFKSFDRSFLKIFGSEIIIQNSRARTRQHTQAGMNNSLTKYRMNGLSMWYWKCKIKMQTAKNYWFYIIREASSISCVSSMITTTIVDYSAGHCTGRWSRSVHTALTCLHFKWP